MPDVGLKRLGFGHALPLFGLFQFTCKQTKRNYIYRKQNGTIVEYCIVEYNNDLCRPKQK